MGRGVSEQELLQKLRAIKAKRLLLIVNACHSGEISPVLGPGEEGIGGTQFPKKTAATLLATGSGRVIITACREHQVSFVGDGSLTLFGQALVDGLQGKGDYVTNRGGFISAYDLYSHLYDTLQAWVPQKVDADVRAQYGTVQEPELTVLKGVGPFAVALYSGATTLVPSARPTSQTSTPAYARSTRRAASGCSARFSRVGSLPIPPSAHSNRVESILVLATPLERSEMSLLATKWVVTRSPATR
jgi:hypothetical protein